MYYYNLNYNDVNAQALFNAMIVKPSSNTQVAINNCIQKLKAEGLWSLLLGLFVFANGNTSQQSALLDWKNPSRTAVAFNSPTFDAGGFTGDGVMSYLELPQDFTSAGVQLNSAHFAIRIKSGTSTNAVFSQGSGTTRQLMTPKNASNFMQGRLNTTSSVATSNTVANRNGRFTFNRVDGTNMEAYKDGSLVQSVASASVGVGSTVNTILRNTTVYVNDQVKYFHFGLGLTSAQEARLNTIFEEYLTAVGGT